MTAERKIQVGPIFNPGRPKKVLTPFQLRRLTIADVMLDALRGIVRDVLGRADALNRDDYELLGRWVCTLKQKLARNRRDLETLHRLCAKMAPSLLGKILQRGEAACRAAWNNRVKRLVLEVGLGNPLLKDFWTEKDDAIAAGYPDQLA